MLDEWEAHLYAIVLSLQSIAYKGISHPSNT